MFKKRDLDKIERRLKRWREGTLKKTLERFRFPRSPTRHYTPLDIKEHDYLEKVGFPGEYPFTGGEYATSLQTSAAGTDGGRSQLIRAGSYSGYGTPEDTRDYYKYMISLGQRGGPNIAFDLPTQCGYDSDDPRAEGEVGKVGVAVDTLHDMETIYEAYEGVSTLDSMASNFTINAPANIIIAMYIALAEKKGVPQGKLRGTPQNDILKEFIARGTYIFPPRPSMRMIRDTITYCTEHVPLMNTISICGFHIREAGATAAQVNAIVLSNAIEYVKLGVEAGLEVDSFVPRFTFLPFSGSMDFFMEIARARAVRRMWAKIMREKFQSGNPRCWMLRGGGGAMTGYYCTTIQRPLNNLIRGVLGGVASSLSGGMITGGVPYDEPLGLGHSLEARQLSLDAARIMQYEANLGEVMDPLAGSYYVESLTDQVEEESWKFMEAIEKQGGSVAAIEKGFIQREIALSAHRYQQKVESGQKVVVGFNKFTGEHELEVDTSRVVEHPYDPTKREEAEAKQKIKLAEVKMERDNQRVQACLKRLKESAARQEVNLIPVILEAVREYATVGEMCNVLREVFGEYQQSKLF